MKEDTIRDSERHNTQMILARRAAKLAQAEKKQEDPGGTLQIVVFLLGDEYYAFELVHVREIFPFIEITPIPCTPPFILGIANIRGEIVSVTDLKLFFGLPENMTTNLSRIIILKNKSFEIGILADKIVGERSVSRNSIQTDLPAASGIGAAYLQGVTHDRIIILNAVQILSDKRILVNESP
ncbi:MAG: chemotaxis protein CheW [Bacteroidetes bacterium]|nr:chemotaxis protein CheW [Bacteroidota bacterium]